MNVKKIFLLIATHGIAITFGFAAGIYMLPILTAPEAPSEPEIKEIATAAMYSGVFRLDLADSDAFHWGEGEISVGEKFITFMGELSPGPDYKLYLSPEFVETEKDFNNLKSSMLRVGDVKTFNNFVVELPTDVNPSDYTSVIIWCESFGEFITAAKYR